MQLVLAMDDLILKASMPFAIVALIAFITYAFIRRQSLFVLATLSSLVVFLALGTVLFWGVATVGASIATAPGSRFIIFAWSIMTIYYVAEFKFRIRLLGSIVMPLALAFMLIATFQGKHDWLPLPLLTVPTFTHVAFVFTAFSLIFLASAAALLYMIKAKRLKSHHRSVLDSQLPPLDTLNRLMEVTFKAGFPILTAGMLFGIAYAGVKLADGWIWSPKVVWTLSNWFIYSVFFVLLQTGRLHGKALARAVIVLFLFVVAAFFFSSHPLTWHMPTPDTAISQEPL